MVWRKSMEVLDLGVVSNYTLLLIRTEYDNTV